jgi:mono/diheme cytochrome c family protein
MRALPQVAMALIAGVLLASCKTSMYENSVTPYKYSGVRLYQVFCSSCHGLTGHGDGPVQPLMRGGVPDLTRIAERNGGNFPREQVRSIIDGREALIAHGTARMPVWGFEFHAGMSNDGLARQRADKMVDRLAAYVETLQPGHDDR